MTWCLGFALTIQIIKKMNVYKRRACIIHKCQGPLDRIRLKVICHMTFLPFFIWEKDAVDRLTLKEHGTNFTLKR
jgi:hypothetical protein